VNERISDDLVGKQDSNVSQFGRPCCQGITHGGTGNAWRRSIAIETKHDHRFVLAKKPLAG